MSVDLGTAYAKMELDHTGFSNGIKDVKSDITSATSQFETASKGITAIGKSMADVGGTLTKSVSVPLLGVAAAGMKVATDFEKSMSSVKAITGATGDDFSKLRNEAIQLGADTAFSSGEVADAMTEMAKAGWNTQQILDGMNGVLAATAASGEQLGTVSTIVADAITGFGMKASDSTRVADLLTQAANSGTIGIGDLGETFKYVAPVAGSMNMSIEDVTQAIAAMSKAGIKGSQAGTSLRGVLLNLVNPSDAAAQVMQTLHISATNADGSFKSLDAIVANLQSSMSGLTDAEKTRYAAVLAGKNASSGLLAILNMTPEAYKEIGDSMDNASGVAEKTAKVMQDNLQSQIEQLGGSLESLAIKLSDLVLPAITEYAKKATEFVNAIVALDEGSQKRLLEVAAALVALGPALIVMGKTLSALGTMVGVFGKLKEGMGIVQAFITVTKDAEAGKLAASFTAMAGPVLVAVAAIAAIVAILVELYNHNERFRNQVNTIGQELLSVVSVMGSKITEFATAIYTALEPVFKTIGTYVSEFVAGFGDATAVLGNGFAALVQSLMPLLSQIWDYMQPVIQMIGVELVAAISIVMGLISGVIAIINPLIAAIGNVFAIVGDINNLIIGIFSGDGAKISEAISQLQADIMALFSNLLAIVGDFVSAFAITFVQAFVNLFEAFGVDISAILSNIVDAIINFFMVTIPEAFNTFVNETVPNFITSVAGWFEQLPYNLGFVIGEIIAYVVGFDAQIGEWIATTLVGFINSIITFFQQLPTNASIIADKVVALFKTMGVQLFEWVIVKIPEFVNTFVDFIATLPGRVWEWIKTIPTKVSDAGPSMNQSGKDIMNALWDGLKSVWDGIADWFEGIVDKVKSWVQGIKDGMASASSASSQANGSHANGLSYVPFNGYMAQLHEGERVLTRNEAENYESGSGRSYVINIYSPKAVDPYEASKILKQTIDDIDEGMA